MNRNGWLLILYFALGMLGCALLPGCGRDNPIAEGTAEWALLQSKRTPRPVQMLVSEDGGTPGGMLTAHVWGGLLEPLATDSARVCQVWHAGGVPENVVTVYRSQFVAGWWMDSGEEFQWPGEDAK